MRQRLILLPLVLCFLLPGCKEKEPAPAVVTWELVSSNTQALAEGVDYTELHFRDTTAAPHIAYVLTADPRKVTLHKGTSGNKMELIPTETQDVLEHMKASVSDGLNVVAAVNGDFFNISSTYMPVGFSVKNGTVLRENTAYRPFSAYTRDGRYIFCDGKTDKVDCSTLSMATGGSHILVRDGALYDVYQQTSLSTVSHPRTLSGVRKDGTMLFVVIDGRQEALSNGATLLQCGQLMLSLGAVDAINHDGGGSSTMILRSGDTYTVANSPSDGNLRKVYCSIQLVLK